MDKAADYYLSQWAEWRWSGHGAVRGYQSRTSFDRLRGSTVRNASISDPAALLVDQAVSQLCKEEPATGRALCHHYLDGLPAYAIGERLRWSHEAVAGAVKRGVDRVGEILDG